MKNMRTYHLAKELHLKCRDLKIRGEIRDQLERASLSVFLNFSEGCAKEGKERLRFFTTALGSLRESQAILDLLDQKDLINLADSLGGHLFRLIRNPGRGPAGFTTTSS